MTSAASRPEHMLIDLADPEQVRTWQALDDVVMGGRSRSALLPGPGFAAFTGELRPENGAGFASVRSAPLELDLARFGGLELALRGDGRAYELRLRDDLDPAAPSHRAAFSAPPGSWARVRVPFEACEPVRRGRPLPEARPLDRRRVRTIALLLADGSKGPFRLELAWIGAYGAPESGDPGP